MPWWRQELESDRVAVLDMGESISVFEERTLPSGTRRVRFERGWCTAVTGDGKTVRRLS